MPDTKRITISGLNYPGNMFIEKVVTYYVEENILYVNGINFFPDIILKLTEKRIQFFDKFGNKIDSLSLNSIEEYIQKIFTDRLLKFKGNRIVNCFKSTVS